MPLASTVTPAGAPVASFQVVFVPVPQPLASTTEARNWNVSPGRTSFFEGRTSRRAGSPGDSQAAGLGSGGALGSALGGGGAALALATGFSSGTRS